ncbi:hypothetical protein [Winogradskyella luteola]|uniref:Uncharacterized protein n=1 Tax=Winogradskyella luteola TaxID=2828330 RepID=A0A9X1JNV4_9FLAO|nr:hypothetical protein [Winogradskyella luteola]MBV7268059.1 hypothetical protein [Winogradskyella luteola]
MKKQVLFLVMVLLGITSATATTAGDAVFNGEDFNNARYRFTEPIVFIERGVEFLIFPDGSFDFNTEILPTIPDNDDYYYKRNRRQTNRTYGAPGTRYHRGDRGVLVRHDRWGRVRRIGNVFINYDRQGRIKRAGSVYMGYRRGQLKQVGGLRILYNRYGNVIGTRGHVNFSNQGCGFCGTTSCTIDHFNDHSFNDDWDESWSNDNSYYYYRKNGKVKKQKKHKH